MITNCIINLCYRVTLFASHMFQVTMGRRKTPAKKTSAKKTQPNERPARSTPSVYARKQDDDRTTAPSSQPAPAPTPAPQLISQPPLQPSQQGVDMSRSNSAPAPSTSGATTGTPAIDLQILVNNAVSMALPQLVQQVSQTLAEQNPQQENMDVEDEQDAPEVEQSVDAALAQHVQQITGTAQNFGTETDAYSDCDTPLDYRLTDKQRLKIWNDEYIDFSALHAPETTKKILKVQSCEDGFTVDQSDVPVSKSANNIDQWVSSMAIFMTVRVQKNPNEAASLVHYMERIRKMAKKNQDWAGYDEKFRRIRAANPNRYPWHKPNLELLYDFMTTTTVKYQPEKRAKQPFRAGSGEKEPPHDYSFCWKYHDGVYCKEEDCKFKHFCYVCEGKHEIFNCKKSAKYRTDKNRDKAKSKDKSSSRKSTKK